MLALPLLIAVGGGYVWATGGRFEETDNAYVKHDIVTVSADVAGRIRDVAVAENQPVKAGDVLFRIDDAQYRIAVEAKKAALAAARLDVQQLKAAWRNAVAAQKAATDTVGYQQTVFDRQQKLVSAGTASQATLDTARHDLQTPARPSSRPSRA
ncbi:HlyD family secretion protein [Methylobrevis pamukkalensis]|uniref:Multidrug resistance protein MdtN n=1 Tax=Methylobrevis pamukkalensis TaxID=1439726 RepID=A0A1E3GY33_9HYPH|nr:biotin/lipoyl-binding protein [Methylobrevis pamukkalensis]ODN68962.1 Multidrug resistance protein MdtN [Methylobrevis pamukkalensis]